ncbi:hypothetical protein ACWEQ7_23540 [Streptomyces sp. NPDC004069]
MPELARLRDPALNTLKFAVAGRNAEMSEPDDPHIRLVDEGLKVHVPSVKGRPARDVPVTYGENPDTCPVRCWLAWQEAKLAARASPDGPAFLPVDQWGYLGTIRLSPDGVGRAMARAAQYAGLTGRRITGHSGRRAADPHDSRRPAGGAPSVLAGGRAVAAAEANDRQGDHGEDGQLPPGLTLGLAMAVPRIAGPVHRVGRHHTAL